MLRVIWESQASQPYGGLVLAMGNAMEFSDVLLEPSEAAAFLKVSLSWLAKARATDDGPPFIRIGRCVRYSKAALLRWLKSRER
jgi:predicted DNA-binding transcriptional regulator AlpA